MKYQNINIECEESQCNLKELENRPISDDMEWKINLFLPTNNRKRTISALNSSNKIETTFIKPNINHKLKTFKTCQKYPNNYQT